MPKIEHERKSLPSALRILPRRIRLMRRAFTRENLVESLKTFAWVAPLTVLIWIYAEQEQVNHDPDVSIPISIHMDNPQRIVKLKQPYPDKVVVAELSGSRAELDSLESKLHRGANGELAVDIPIDPALPPYETQQIRTESALAAVAPFKQSGVTIKDCQPEYLAVDIAILREEDIPVQAPPDATNIVGQPVFSPATVKVRGPERAIDEARKSGKLFAYADFSGFNVLKTPGNHEISGVHLTPLDDKSLTFDPTEVKAILSVRENNVSHTFPSLFVWVVGSADTMAGYRVECTQTSVPNVTIVGPPDKIEMISRPDFSPKPRAVLEVRPTDPHDVKLQRSVKIELPPEMGLHVQDESAIRPVEFELITVHTGD